MNKRPKILIVGATALALAAGGAGVASAGGSGEDQAEGPDVAISGSALDQASAAALDHTGGGTVSGTEVGDEESRYEVEVTLSDGSQVDVQLDRDFSVVGEEADGAGEDESGDQ
ncbi:MAG: PepSY domain-containing protein [Solirubrobacterales bacterium]|nr:PepSY domain-containing protein [Solirubrobacterales bacterium]